VKPLLPDVKAQNAIFLSTLRKRWLKKRDEMVAKVGKTSIALLDNFVKKQQQSKSAGEENPTAEDLKRRALSLLGIGRLFKWVETDEDEKKEKEKENADEKRNDAAKAHDAFVRGKKAMELWLPNKEDISLPPKPARFVFATGGRTGHAHNPAVPLRSKQSKIPSSTADLMRTSGLRVVHALSKGRQGKEGDLEKSRSQLERDGFISKRNYDEESEYKSARVRRKQGSTLDIGERVEVKVDKGFVAGTIEKRTENRFEVEFRGGEDGERNTRDTESLSRKSGAKIGLDSKVEANEEVKISGDETAFVTKDLSKYKVVYQDGSEEKSVTVRRDEENIRKLSEKQQRQAAADDSYHDWLEQKRARELARDYLKNIETPDELKGDDGQLAQESMALDHWKDVGKHLKIIDRSLLDEWFDWSKGFGVSYYICNVLWDSFQPIGDDVHTTYYSLARQTLGKVLRPNLNYQAAANKIVQRKWSRAQTGVEFDFEDATEADLKEYKKFNRRDLKALLIEIGIELKHEELRLIVDSFDTGDDGTMPMQEFIEFTGPLGPRNQADVRHRLDYKAPPVWESTCPKTGLSNAYRVTIAPSNATEAPADKHVRVVEKANEEKRRVVELKERQRRLAILEQFDAQVKEDDDDDGEEDYEDEYSDDGDGDGSPRGKASKREKKKCTVAKWLEHNGLKMKQKRKNSLRILMNMSRSRRDEAELQNLLEKGEPPAAPGFYSAGPSDPRVGNKSLETSLLLCWEPAPNSLVAFYSIEMSGPQGSREQRENNFTEIWRDPKSSQLPFKYQYEVPNLQPGTSYFFRIRAFNGFGPGPYNWEKFTTRPSRPNKPVVVSRSPNTVTLRWAGNDELDKHLQILDKAFDEEIKSGQRFARSLLVDGLARRARGLFEYIETTKTVIGFSGEHLSSPVSILDAIDVNDGRDVSVKDVRDYLTSTAQAQQRSRSGAAPSASASQVRYSVEQCLSVTTQQWKKVMTTKFGHVTINALESGVPYRFRVIALNCNGLESKKSPSCVVSTMLETPPVPRVAPLRGAAEVAGAALKLVWDPAAVFAKGLSQREQRKHNIEKILNSWTREGADDEGAISVEAIFQRQQTFEKNHISIRDLSNLLRDLGLEPTESRKAEVLEALDLSSEQISLDQMKAWWNSDKVTYEVRRDSGVSLEFLPHGKSSAMQQYTPSSSVNVVCSRRSSSAERDDARNCVVAGLEPNTRYRFTLRLITSRSQSLPSKVLEAYTAPEKMERPVVVNCDFAKSVTVKWYPGRNGSHKYILEARLHEALDWEKDRSVEIAQNKIKALGWKTVYEGHDNTVNVPVAGGASACSGIGLLPNSAYHFRVTGVNAQGVDGVPSENTLCKTAGRSSRAKRLRPANAHEYFSVECSGDVVVGDTIIFTEQLFVGPDGKLLKNGNSLVYQSIRGKSSRGDKRCGIDRFVGERTIAAQVSKDSYRSPQHTKEYGVPKSTLTRMLRLEVIWSTCSSEEAAVFVLGKDQIIERDQGAIFQFETFRVEWKEEARRLSESQERRLCKRLLL
jgi:Ca2+-binding EF-hand superfamily protein